jgi:hypothetical protein
VGDAQFISAKEKIKMNRFLMAGASALATASIATGGLILAGPASASAAHRAAALRPTATATCSITRHRYPFPGGPAPYAAGAAGMVTVAPVNPQTIMVAKVASAPGYTAFVDTARGSSVDVYFHNQTSKVKFEAEINDLGGLTVKVTTCPR